MLGRSCEWIASDIGGISLFTMRKESARYGLLAVVTLALLPAPSVHAQASAPYDPFEDVSNNPLRMYQGSDIDSVDLDTGGLTVRIPLISYPQRGGILRVDFALSAALPGSGYTEYSIPDGGQRKIWKGPVFSGTSIAESPSTIYTGFPSFASDVSPGGTGESWDQGWVLEGDGSEHYMGWVTSTQGRALDGSGFLVTAPGLPFDAGGGCINCTITDKNGVQTKYTSGSSTVTTSDPNGNTMTLTSASGSVPTITDTVGRVLPVYSSNNTWTLPGVSGGSETFTFTQPEPTQAVVALPNGATYTFQYTVITLPLLTGQTTAQKTELLSQVTLPTGGTISWSYARRWSIRRAPQVKAISRSSAEP